MTRSGIDIGWPLWNVCVTNDHGYVVLVVSTSRCLLRPWFITGFVPRLTRRVPLVDQELPTLPEHLRSPPVFSGVRVSRSLVLGVCFIYHCLPFCTFSLAGVLSNPYIFKANTIINTSICPGWQTKYDIINLICQLIN